MLLFAAATGSPPVSARALGDLADLQRRPLSAAALAPHLPPDLTRRLDDLVSADPQRRRAALDGLPPATGSLRLRPPLPAPGTVASAPALPRGPAPPTLARPDPPLGDWLVLLDAEASLGARRRLAALLEVPTARLMGEGAQVVAVGRNAEEAQAALSRLEAAHAPLRRVAAPQSRLPAGAALGGGLLLGLFSLILPPPLSLLGLGLALVLAVAGAGLLARAGGAIGDPARLRRAWAALKAPVPAPTDPIATSALGLRQARKAVLERDLPVAVRQDLLASLDELEAELEGLEGAPAARADLDLLDGAAAAIRDAASAHTPAPDLDRTAALARGRAAAAAKALGREG